MYQRPLIAASPAAYRKRGDKDGISITRRLGGTSAEVTVMGLGTATLAGNMELVAELEAKMIVIDGFDSGIRYFDTAPFYGYGKSEHFVGDELRSRRRLGPLDQGRPAPQAAARAPGAGRRLGSGRSISSPISIFHMTA